MCFFVSQSSLPLLGGTTPSCLIHSPVMDIWLVFSFHLIFKLASFIPDPKYLLETSPIFLVLYLHPQTPTWGRQVSTVMAQRRPKDG